MAFDLGCQAADRADADPLDIETLLHHDNLAQDDNIPSLAKCSIRRKPVPIQASAVGKQCKKNDNVTSRPESVRRKSTFTRTRWRLSYLQRLPLLAFTILFLVLLVALQVVLQVSRQHHGLAATVESRHYLWKYGPTAIVVMISALWARVTYQAKLAQPWIDLAKGPHPAERTVLVDYVSSWEPAAFVRSIVHQHHLVTITISGTVLLKILTVFSTALIFGELVTYNRTNVELEANGFLNDHSNLASVGAVPMLSIVSALNTSAGWPSGTSKDYAFQTFSTSSVPSASQLQAQVEVFAGNVECDVANISFANWTVYTTYAPKSTTRSQSSKMDFVSRECLIQLRDEAEFDIGMANSDDLNTTTWRWAKFMLAHCGNSTAAETGRILVSVGELNTRQTAESIAPIYTPMTPNGTNRVGSVNLDITRSTNFICKPLYSITKRSVLMDATNSAGNDNAAVVMETNNAINYRILDQVHTWDIAQVLDTATLFDNTVGDSYFPNFLRYTDKLNVDLALRVGMQLRSSIHATVDEMFDQSALRDATERFYRTFAAQIVHAALMNHNSSIITGNAIIKEYRILVQSTPVYVMSAILAVMAVIAGVSVFLSPRGTLAPLDPSTIPGFALVAAESRELMSLMGRNDPLEFSDSASLAPHDLYFSTACQIGTGLSSIKKTELIKEFRRPNKSVLQSHWFQPLVMKRIVQMPLLFLTIAIVIGLEASLLISSRHNGLGIVAQDSNLRYVWTYLPAVILVLLSIYVSSIDACTKTFAPYHRLKRGCHWRAVRRNLLDQTSVHAIAHAIRSSNWVIALTTSATVLGSFLPIVESGVYDVEIQSTVTDVQFKTANWFSNSGIFSLALSSSGIFTAGLILNANASYPVWTYENLALAGVVIGANATGNSTELLTSNSTTRARIPGLRPRYECRIYPDDELIVNFTTGLSQFGQTKYTNALSVIVEPETPQFLGEPNEINSLYTSIRPNSYFGVTARITSDFVFMWGKMGATDVESVSVSACNMTNFDEVLVNVTLVGRDLRVDELSPPQPDESTVRSSVYYGYSFAATVAYLGDTSLTDDLNEFFSTLVFGRYGIPLETLESRSNDAVVMNAIYWQLQIIGAQLATNSRQPDNLTNLGTISYSGTVSNPDRDVLVQNIISTHVLVAMLLIILALVFTSIFIMDTRQILPFEPTTIAAMASLLAYSNIVDDEITLAEFASESSKTSKRKSVSRKIVKLGWFDEQNNLVNDKLRTKGEESDLERRIDGVNFTINIVVDDKN